MIDENAAEDYETLLRKEEKAIRQYICIQHQLKLYIEKLNDKIQELEKDNLIFLNKIGKFYFFIFLGNNEKNK